MQLGIKTIRGKRQQVVAALFAQQFLQRFLPPLRAAAKRECLPGFGKQGLQIGLSPGRSVVQTKGQRIGLETGHAIEQVFMSPRQGQLQLIEWHLILLDKGIEPAPVDLILEGGALFPLGNLFLGWGETILFPQGLQLGIGPFLHGGVEPHHPGLCRHILNVGKIAIPKIIIQRLFKGLSPGDIAPNGGGQLLLVEPHPGQVARDLRHHQLVAVDLDGGIIFPQQCFALGEQLVDLHGKVGKVGQRILQGAHHGALGIRYARLVGGR
ncbi:hypothetical protein D3C80_957660 [compost metagenome]